MLLWKPQTHKQGLTLVMSMKAVLFLGAPLGGEEDLFTCGPSSCRTQSRENWWHCALTLQLGNLSFCNGWIVCNLSVDSILLLKHAFLFTLFSEVLAVSLGILLTAVTLGFFPLDTGMAGFFLPPNNTATDTDALQRKIKVQLGFNSKKE